MSVRNSPSKIVVTRCNYWIRPVRHADVSQLLLFDAPLQEIEEKGHRRPTSASPCQAGDPQPDLRFRSKLTDSHANFRWQRVQGGLSVDPTSVEQPVNVTPDWPS